MGRFFYMWKNMSIYAQLVETRSQVGWTEDPSAVAVVERMPDGQYKIIGDIISATKLWKCDYLAAAWALANLSAGQFVMGVEDNVTSRSLPDFDVVNSTVSGDNKSDNGGGGSARLKKFSSGSIGFFSNT